MPKFQPKFLNPEELKALAKLKSDRPIVSLYLNTDNLPGKTWVEVNSFYHQLGQEFKKDHKKILGKTLAKIEKLVKEHERDKNIKTLVFFAAEDRILEMFALPVAVASQAVVENRAFIRPLSRLMDEFARYGVVAVDRNHARLFTIYLGAVEEQSGFFEDIVHKQIKTQHASWKGLAAKRMFRHIEEDLKFHFKNTAAEAEKFFRKNKVEKIIIGGHDDIVAKFKKVLTPDFSKKIIGSFRLQIMTDSADVVRDKSLEVMENHERVEEAALLKELMRKSGPGAKAVLGLEKVLAALEKGKAKTLFIDGDWTAVGYICRKDDALMAEGARCSVCGGGVEATGNFVNKLIERAIATGAKVEHIFYKHPEFEKYHIGATLRY